MVSKQFYLDRVKRALGTAVDAIFPRHCVRCDKEGSLLCTTCKIDWRPTIPTIEMQRKAPHGLFSSFHYADPIANQLIRSWKYHFDESAWRHLQNLISLNDSHIDRTVIDGHFDCVVPLPLHSKRLCERGFDQAERIAEMMHEKYYLPVRHVIARSRSTGRQADRNIDDRKKEMTQNPFIWIGSRPVPKRVLLVDDVWTTGATAIAASRELRRAGVETVWVYTIARG